LSIRAGNLALALWQKSVCPLRESGITGALKRLMTTTSWIGTFEVSVNRELDGELYWAGEIQQIVAGVAKDDLRNALQIEKHHRSRGSNQKLLKIIAVEHLGPQLAYCLKRLVEERRAYISANTGRQDRRHLPPQPEHWAEHDAWLLGLPLGARSIAYGCTRRGLKFHARE
jgi:hypothetical protein